MKGTMLIISPTGSVKTSPLSKVPELEEIQEVVGGYIELVPHLKTIEYNGMIHPCAAFCNEEGKLKGLPRNDAATRMWAAALKRAVQPHQRLDNDVLVGKIVVIFGDRELMAEL